MKRQVKLPIIKVLQLGLFNLNRRNNMKYWITMLTLLVSLSASAFEREDFYNEKYCAELGGVFDSRHKDTGATAAKIDCETDTVAWEGEWASNKSYEGVGQSLWYASVTGKIPGILFYFKEGDKYHHQKFIDRARLTFESLGIEFKIKVFHITK